MVAGLSLVESCDYPEYRTDRTDEQQSSELAAEDYCQQSLSASGTIPCNF